MEEKHSIKQSINKKDQTHIKPSTTIPQIDTMIYLESQRGEKPRAMIIGLLIIQGRITIANTIT